MNRKKSKKYKIKSKKYKINLKKIYNSEPKSELSRNSRWRIGSWRTSGVNKPNADTTTERKKISNKYQDYVFLAYEQAVSGTDKTK